MKTWFFLALGASVIWGLTYAINEYLLRYLDPLIILFISSFFIWVGLGGYFIFTHHVHDTIQKFSGHYKLLGAMAAYIFFYLIAALLILKSIDVGNASLSALIESSYPLFTMGFAYLILREVQFNWGVAAGAGLILAGLVVVQVTQ